eukprot:CAMPEP_0176419802 /NCGR_PEP_ID=MMETSP0127-20121128/8257_1 /TAXON_ID=938130 /ORGANISM="Platyophrya macrostoma, Strain WH" /LENGTH=381 /DNA_ID=CAMNT_0017800335 /DNA_START=19 /DNA_END=1164 /DNA_ORIENTATION=+
MQNRVRSASEHIHENHQSGSIVLDFNPNDAELNLNRSSSLRKLSRNINTLIAGSPTKSPKRKSLIKLEGCRVVNVSEEKGNTIEIQIQEGDGSPSRRKKSLSSKVCTFEGNAPALIVSGPINSLPTKEKPKSLQDVGNPSEKFCRFCFETDENGEKGPLICPCRCDGSLKHIHEICLKTWLSRREAEEHSSVISGKCEICGTVYHIEAVRKLHFSCSRAFNEGFGNLLICIGLAVCVGNLIWLAIKYLSMYANDMESIYKGLAILFPVLTIFFTGAMIVYLKRAFFEMRMMQMKIYDYDPEHEKKKIAMNAENLANSGPIRIRDNANNRDDILSSDSDEDESPAHRNYQNRNQYPNPQQSQNISLDASNHQLVMLNGSQLS